MIGLFGLIIGGILYIIPTLLALDYNRKNLLLIFLINFLSGWTIIG
jgi:hypothetical protein